MTISPEFSALTLVLAVPLVAYLAVGEPLLGRRMYADLERRRERDPAALVRYFSVSLGIWAATGVLAAAVLAVSSGVDRADVGLTAPDEPGWAAVIMLAFAVAAVAGTVRLRRLARDGRNVPGQSAIAAMLPRTRAERRLAAVVAVAEGVWAELLYRGLLIALLVGVAGLNLYVAAGVALAVYAAAGWYQGSRGLVVFAFFGALMTSFYLMTESLLLPAAIHVVLTLRDLVLIPAPPQTKPSLERDHA